MANFAPPSRWLNFKLRHYPKVSPNVSLANLRAAARSVGQEIFIVEASTASEIDTAFTTLVHRRVGALFINGDTFFLNQRHQLAALLAHYKLPANYNTREFVEAGGLMSYGDDRFETRRQ